MRRREMLAALPLLLLTGCGGDEPAAKVVEKKAAEPVTGLHALYGMFARARAWAPDVRVVRITSVHLTEVAAVPGKAAAWQAVFASPALGQSRSYVSSVFERGVNLHEGITPEAPGSWKDNGKTFAIGDVKTDTDKSWEIAKTHGGKYAAEHPDMTISFSLETGRKDRPVWRVLWGENAASSHQTVIVDAADGTYIAE